MATWITPKSYVDDDYLTFAEVNAAMGPLGNLQWLKDAFERIGITADSGLQTVDSALVGGRVYGGSQEIPDSVWTPVVWSSQRVGRLGGKEFSWLVPGYPTLVHIPTRPALPVEQRGYYAMGAHVAFAGNTTGVRGVRLVSYLTGVTFHTVFASKTVEAVSTATEQPLSISTFDIGHPTSGRLFGGYSLSVEVYQDSGDKLTLNASPNLSPECWLVRLAASL